MYVKNWRKKAFGRSPSNQESLRAATETFGCSGVIAHSLVRRFEQTGISIDSRIDVSGLYDYKNKNLKKWFLMCGFILTPYSFPTLPVSHYTDLLRIEHPLVWYFVCLI